MHKRIFAAAGLTLLLGGVALANGGLPPFNVPELADWEQILLQNLTGPNGVPVMMGASPAASGTCAIGTVVGGQAGGSFKTTGTCTAQTVIFTFLSPAPNGFECGAKDITTPADTLLETSYTTTSVTFTGTLVSADQLIWSCRAF